MRGRARATKQRIKNAALTIELTQAVVETAVVETAVVAAAVVAATRYINSETFSALL